MKRLLFVLPLFLALLAPAPADAQANGAYVAYSGDQFYTISADPVYPYFTTPWIGCSFICVSPPSVGNVYASQYNRLVIGCTNGSYIYMSSVQNDDYLVTQQSETTAGNDSAFTQLYILWNLSCMILATQQNTLFYYQDLGCG